MGFWSYILRLRGGRRYVGHSSKPRKRISDHFRGRGATFTKRWRPVGVVSVFRHKTKGGAKRGERSAYHKTSRRFGKSRVRGAGHTKRW